MESQVAAQVTDNKNQKVKVNPFAHIIKGNKNLIKTSLTETAAIVVLQFFVSLALSALFFVLLGSTFSDMFSSRSSDVIMNSLVKLGLFVIIAALIVGYFNIVFNRIILAGSRAQKESLGNAFSLSLKRYPKVILLMLSIILIFVGGAVVTGILSAFLPGTLLKVIAVLAALVVAIIFILRISYTQFVVVEDKDPGGVMAIIKESAAYWKRSGGALVLYIITIFIISILISAVIAPTTSSTSNLNYGSSANLSNEEFFNELEKELNPDLQTVLTSQLLDTVVSSVISVVVLCGIANIYNEARELEGANKTTVSTASV